MPIDNLKLADRGMGDPRRPEGREDARNEKENEDGDAWDSAAAVEANSGSRQISLRMNGGASMNRFRAFPERNNDNSMHHHDSSKHPLYGRSKTR
jgi:hypothetical protein